MPRRNEQFVLVPVIFQWKIIRLAPSTCPLGHLVFCVLQCRDLSTLLVHLSSDGVHIAAADRPRNFVSVGKRPVTLRGHRLDVGCRRRRINKRPIETAQQDQKARYSTAAGRSAMSARHLSNGHVIRLNTRRFDDCSSPSTTRLLLNDGALLLAGHAFFIIVDSFITLLERLISKRSTSH
jgi:hypothetical protein